MHIVPFYNRSLFDDIDTWFDDLLWDSPFGYSLYPARGRQQPQTSAITSRPKNWNATVRLTGYRPEEVKWECGEGNATVRVHARHQGDSEDDFSEIRRTIQVPDTVDRNQLNVSLTREGILVVKAPYKQQQQTTGGGGALDVFNPWSMTPFGRDWSSLTDEMRALQNEMLQLYQQSFPGSMNTNFVQGEDGSTKLRLNFDLSGYKPEEINISQEGNQVTVEANHEKKTEHGSSKKHFKRVFTLPQTVNVGR